MQRSKNKKEQESILKEFIKNKKYYTDDAFEILQNDIINDLELDNKKQQAKLKHYIKYLTSNRGLCLKTIQNGILSGVNSEYLLKNSVT
jgi:hypothetical protein